MSQPVFFNSFLTRSSESLFFARYSGLNCNHASSLYLRPCLSVTSYHSTFRARNGFLFGCPFGRFAPSHSLWNRLNPLGVDVIIILELLIEDTVGTTDL